jgi:hypothetical protein
VEQIRKRLTYANVMSSLAVFLVLGGGAAFAAKLLPEKSVGERQLRPGAVTASKLRKNAVTAPKIKALAVKVGKLANDAVTTSKLGAGAVATQKIGTGAVTGEKIAADAVTGDKVDEGSLGQVPSASKASFATAAESANPVVFAKIGGDGSVDPSNSKGISGGDVNSPSTGIYCVSAPGFGPKGAQVTLVEEPNAEITARIRIGGPQCPSPKVEVLVWKGTVGVKNAFFIMLYR